MRAFNGLANKSLANFLRLCFLSLVAISGPALACPDADAAPTHSEANLSDNRYSLDLLVGGAIGMTPGMTSSIADCFSGLVDYADGYNAAGYLADAPDINFYYAGDNDLLRVSVTPAEISLDTILAVVTPDGDWLYNDDRVGVNPEILIESPAAGTYRVWVGARHAHGLAKPARLTIASLAAITQSAGKDCLNEDAAPAYGETSLSALSAPSAYAITTAVGGPINAEDCFEGVRGHSYGVQGYFSENPTLTVRVTDDEAFDAAALRINLNQADDAPFSATRLLIHTPEDRWIYDDAADDLYPQVILRDLSAGRYSIWVGALTEEDRSVRSERSLIETSNLPCPDLTASLTYGSASLVSGLTPNPYRLEVPAGGAVHNDDCFDAMPGLFTAAPSFRFSYDGAADILRVTAEAGHPTALLIATPEGDWLYDEQSGGGGTPAILIGDPEPGFYKVWVGARFEAALSSPTTLSIAEPTMR